MATAWIPMDNPFQGLAASVVTSHPIDFRDAVAWSFSWYTTAGTTSAHTLQLSNTSVDIRSDLSTIVEASWVNYTTFGTGTPAMFFGDAGARWGRILRNPSGSSQVQEFAKLIGT